MKFHITWPTGLSEFIEHEAETLDALAMSMWGKATAELVALEHRVLIALHVEKEAVETGAERLAAQAAQRVADEAEAVAAALAPEQAPASPAKKSKKAPAAEGESQ